MAHEEPIFLSLTRSSTAPVQSGGKTFQFFRLVAKLGQTLRCNHNTLILEARFEEIYLNNKNNRRVITHDDPELDMRTWVAYSVTVITQGRST